MPEQVNEAAPAGRINLDMGSIKYINDKGVATIEFKGLIIRDMSEKAASAQLLGIMGALSKPAEDQVSG